MSQQAALEKQALDQLRRNDLRGAHGTLALLASLRPHDDKVRRRIEQVEALIQRREEQQQRMQAEPLRYAHAYIKAGRLEDGLRLLRAAIARDPANPRLRELALQLARRIKATAPVEDQTRIAERELAEHRLRESSSSKKPAPAAASGPAPASALASARPSAPPSPAAPVPPPTAAAPRRTDAPSPRLGALHNLLGRIRDRRRSPSRWLEEASAVASAAERQAR